jgi:NAD(P)-dependent dehydrogenase (short-subunit alcohol dehydrogenase family)
VECQRELDLAGKVAIVTGASRGIGKAVALALAGRGVDVVVAARTVNPRQKLPGTIGETVAEIEALGVKSLAVAADLAKEEDLHHLVDSAIDRFGGVDILINNAAVTMGFSWSTPFVEMPRQDWLYHYAVNLHAPFTLMQRVVPSMEERGGGRILNVTTGSAECMRQPEEPPPLDAQGDFSIASPAYFSSKRGLDRLSNVIAPQLARKNVYVISVMPGLVFTELVDLRMREEGLDGSVAVPMAVPARMLVYFAACANPTEYMGRIFWAERELAELGIELDDSQPV